MEKLNVNHVRSTLWNQQKRLKELLKAVEMDALAAQVALRQIVRIEEELRWIRKAA